VLIRRRDVRLRERRIGPYKYPTIDRTKEEKSREKNRAINPEKQSTQNTTQKKYRVKNRNINPKQSKKPKKKTEHKPKNIYTEKERKAEGSHGSALFSSLQENN
jgi:hypothetical protein